MRTFVAAAALVAVAVCSGGGSDAPKPPQVSMLNAAEAVQLTCEEVRAGIDEFNRQDYAGTVEHFEKAKGPAKVYARVDPEPEADQLLDAVEYYANLAPEDYPEAARTSEHFARNKAITLGQCASNDPIDETPPTPV